MTIEEAVRQELRDAHHEEIRLFAAFMQSMSEPQACRIEGLLRQQQLQEAAQKVVKLRTVLYGVLEGERIWKERTIRQLPEAGCVE